MPLFIVVVILLLLLKEFGLYAQLNQEAVSGENLNMIVLIY